MTIEFWHPRLGVQTWSEERYEAYKRVGAFSNLICPLTNKPCPHPQQCLGVANASGADRAQRQ